MRSPFNERTTGSGSSGALTPTQQAAFENAQPLRLPKWRLALSKTRNGISDSRILCLGDSTTAGNGSSTAATVPNLKSYPHQLFTLLNSSVCAFTDGLGIPPSTYATGPDTRWTVGSGWSLNGQGAASGCAYYGNSPAGNLVYTSGVNANQYYVYYLTTVGGPSLTITATGGTPVVQSTNAAAGIARVLVTALAASTANTVSIASAAGNVWIVAVEPLLSTQKQVIVGNAGVGGATTTNWASGPFNTTWGGLGFISAVAPDLTIISMGINDAGVAASVATVTAQLQLLITRAQLTGDVILCDMLPSQSAPYPANEALYVPAIAALAGTNNIPYFSIYGRRNSVWSTDWMADALHGNDYAYWDWAQGLTGVVIS